MENLISESCAETYIWLRNAVQLLRRQYASINVYCSQGGIAKDFDWQIKHEVFMLDSAENENVIRWTENWMKAKERTGKME